MVLRVTKTKHAAMRIANEYLRRHRPRGPAPMWAEPPCTLLLQSRFSGSLNIIIQLNCPDTSQYTSGRPLTGRLLHRLHPEFPFCLPSHRRRYPPSAGSPPFSPSFERRRPCRPRRSFAQVQKSWNATLESIAASISATRSGVSGRTTKSSRGASVALLRAPVSSLRIASDSKSSPFSDLPLLLHFSLHAAQSNAQTFSSRPPGDGRQKCRRRVDRNRIRDSRALSERRTPCRRLL